MGSLFMDICQQIDVFNHDYNSDKLSLKNKYCKYVMHRKLFSLIENFANARVYDNDTIYSFFRMYYASKDTINIDGFDVTESEINKLIIATYIKENSVLKITCPINNPNIFSLHFNSEDSDEYKYTKEIKLPNRIYYSGEDTKKRKIIEYTDSLLRFLMTDYLTKRMELR